MTESRHRSPSSNIPGVSPGVPEKGRTHHEAIALRYEKKAATAPVEADVHAELEDAYATASPAGTAPATDTQRRKRREHCAALVKSYRGAALAFSLLSKSHRQAAQKLE